MVIFNELNYPGFRLNTEKYTSYVNDYEYVLPQGEKVDVSDVEEQFQASNMSDLCNALNDTEFTLIFLLRFG